MVSYKCCLRQAVSLDHTRTHAHTHTKALSFSLKGSYCTSSHPFLSHTFFLILNCYHIWFNYSTSLLNPLSPSLFSSLSLPLEHLISLLSTLLLHPSHSFTISLFASQMHAPSPPVSPHFHLFLCYYCLRPLPFSFSLICSERVIYTATTHAEWSRAEQSSEGSLTCQNGHHLKNATKLFFSPSLHLP